MSPNRVLSPAVIARMRHPSLPPHTWYIVAAAALCALNQPKAVAEVFDDALGDADGLEQRRVLAKRYREALIKVAGICGLPKTILCLLELKKSTPPELLDDPESSTQRTRDFYATPAEEVLERGQKFFDTTYGQKSQSMMRVLRSCGTPDLEAAARLSYAFYSSNPEVLSDRETIFIMVAGGVANKTKDTTENHKKGSINHGVNLLEINAVCDVAAMICDEFEPLQASRPRSSTKGPLDADDDPISEPSTPRGLEIRPRRTPSSTPRQLASPSVTQLGESQPKDFSFLLRPEIYHPLTPLNVPVAFRNSPKQPDPAASLDELLAKGHFRAAAIVAVQELTGGRGAVDPTDAPRIFHLLYTRLVCLTLIDATPLAAQEVKALEDLSNARTYIDDDSGEHLVPWELRVLNVRLQALGFGDPRRAVMSYHDLAREARDHARRHDASAPLWTARLHDLGVKVAGALIDMDDLAGAAHHLRTMRDRGDGKIALAKALLWLHLGDVESARACTKDAADTDRLVLALCDMADGDYEAALAKWEGLRAATGTDEMVGINTAVCLLYLGRISEGRGVLESLLDAGRASHTLLFNLSTMYELCTERNRHLKTRLAEKVAAMDESPAGWEKLNADFKL